MERDRQGLSVSYLLEYIESTIAVCGCKEQRQVHQKISKFQHSRLVPHIDVRSSIITSV